MAVVGFSQDIEAPIGLNEVSVEGLNVSRNFDIHMAPENKRKAGVSKQNSRRFGHMTARAIAVCLYFTAIYGHKTVFWIKCFIGMDGLDLWECNKTACVGVL